MFALIVCVRVDDDDDDVLVRCCVDLQIKIGRILQKASALNIPLERFDVIFRT